MFAGKKSAQIREILISESAWEEMTCLFAPSLKAVAMKCIPFNKNDIHTWDSPLSEPIYYEKVKQTIDNSMLKILHTLK